MTACVAGERSERVDRTDACRCCQGGSAGLRALRPWQTRRVDPGFWRGRRVLLTGHTGFKGAWLALWLAELGAEVTGVALEPDTIAEPLRAAGLERRIDSRIGDVRDPAAVERRRGRAGPRSCSISRPSRWSAARTPIRSARTPPT